MILLLSILLVALLIGWATHVRRQAEHRDEINVPAGDHRQSDDADGPSHAPGHALDPRFKVDRPVRAPES